MFTLRKIEGGRINVYEPLVYPVGSSPVIEGEALVLTSGKLTKCGPATKPTFIALSDGEASTATVTVEIPVGRVESNQVYEVPVTAVPASVGIKVQLSTTADSVTATTTDGVAEIVDLNGATAAGDTVYVRFS